LRPICDRMPQRSYRPASAPGQTHVLDAVARWSTVIGMLAVIFAVFRLFNGADTPFLAFATIGAAVVHATTRPCKGEIAFTLALGAVLAAAYQQNHGEFGRYPGARIVAAAGFWGLAAMLVLGWRAARSTHHLASFLTAVFCPAVMIVTNLALAMAIGLSPKVFDLYLYRLDGMLGAQFSFVAGQWLQHVPFLLTTCFLVYSSLPLVEVVLFLLFLRGYRMPANPLIACAVAGIAGFALYQICPATGPVHVFGAAFPKSLPGLMPVATIALPNVPRNAIPSLHSAWALLIAWNVRYCPRWMRLLAMLFLAFTLLATLGLGEDYLIDFAVAAPFTVGVQMASIKSWTRSVAAFGLAIAWRVYARLGVVAFVPAPGVLWAIVIGTLACSAVLAGFLPLARSLTSANALSQTCATRSS